MSGSQGEGLCVNITVEFSHTKKVYIPVASALPGLGKGSRGKVLMPASLVEPN